MTHPEITAKSWLMIAALGLVWGSNFLLIEIALTGITPFWLAAGRISFACVLTVAVWRMAGGRLFHAPIGPADWTRVAIIGALSSAVPFMLISWGQQFVTAGFAGVSMASVALIVLPLAHFLLPGERMTWRRTLGFVIGFVGVVVLVGPDAFGSTGSGLELAGRLACVGAAACYGVSTITMRRLPPVDPLGLAAVTLVFGTVVVLTAAVAVEGPPPSVDMQTVLIIAFMGLAPTAGANFLRTVVVRSAGPVFMSITNYLVPLVSVISGVLILGEPVEASLFWALVLILAGVGLSQYGAFRRLFART